MDKDKVIELAKRAQIGDSHGHMIRHEAENLVAFAQLVRDDYRAELLAGSGEPVAWLNPHGGMLSSRYVSNFATGLEKETHTIPLHTSDQLAAAVLRERERLLAGYREIAESSDLEMRDGDLAREIAAKLADHV
jgi:hypothetical protein